MEEKLASILGPVRARQGHVVVLTGAGISAESGIPTFRGEEGYWVVGSRNYMPQEMATWEMFEQAPDEVWRWYLHRFGICRDAAPNAGHAALVRLERALGDRFTLVTQNIDGLHRRAGSQRVYCIHGDAAYVRCAAECGLGVVDLPPGLVPRGDGALTAAERAALRCPRCEGWLRPHVLWFDEYYDEEHYRFSSSIRAATQAAVLVVAGTSGATNLPMQVGQLALQGGALMVDINPEANPFSQMTSLADRGYFLQGAAAELLPRLL